MTEKEMGFRGSGVRALYVKTVRESNEWENTVTLSVHCQIGNVTKGGSTGSADTAEGVKKRICGRPHRGSRTAGLDPPFFEPVVWSTLV